MHDAIVVGGGAEDQHMTQAVAPERSDQALNIWVLPGATSGDRVVPNPHRPDSICEGLPVGAVIVAHQIGRCRVPREMPSLSNHRGCAVRPRAGSQDSCRE
jgi:hypothetical protein